MEKSTVYFTDFRCPVGTSQLVKLKKLCVAAGIKDIDKMCIRDRYQTGGTGRKIPGVF